MEPVLPLISQDSDFRRLLAQLQGRAFAVSPPLEWDGFCFLGVFCPGVCDTCIGIPLEPLGDTIPDVFGLEGSHVYVHSLKEITLWLTLRNGEIVSNRISDVSVASGLLSPPEPDRGEDFRKFFLRNLVFDHLKERYPFLPQEVEEYGAPAVFHRRVRQDAVYVWRIAQEVLPRLESDPALVELYRTVELPLIPILADMERRGVGIDRNLLEKNRSRHDRAIEVLGAQLKERSGMEVNVFSEDDVRILASDVCRIKVKRPQRIDDDFIRTTARKHPVMRKVYRLRRLRYLTEVFDRLDGAGRVRPKWWLTRTSTGRIQCTNPNLQSLPRAFRNKYLSPGDGRVFIKADYSASQLRILAHLSGDSALTELFRNGRNPHDETRDRLMERGIACTRSQAKAINFLICYGGAAWTLMDELGVSLKHAHAIARELKAVYPGAVGYLAKVGRELAELPPEKRFVRSVGGRVRRFTFDGKPTRRQKRQAANAVVQMSESDVFKKAIISLDVAFRREGLPVVMDLLLHDGIWFTCPDNETVISRAKEVIRMEMEGAVELSAPLKADLE